MSTLHDSSTVEHAHSAARHMAMQWIRTVFQEFCYQLWKDNWEVNDLEGTEARYAVHLTPELIQQAHAACEELVDRWGQKLRARGHSTVAQWIQDVCHTEMDTFFCGDDEHEEKEEEEKSQIDEPPEEPPVPRKEQQKTCVLAALRQLELPPPDGIRTQAQREQFVIDQLDEMGYAGKTYWPLDWAVIQEAARNLPARLHPGHAMGDNRGVLKLKLVPKSSIPSEPNNNNEDSSQITDKFPPKSDPDKWTEKMVVDYKRRGPFSKRKAPPANKTGHSRPKRSRSIPEEAPRPPCDFQRAQIPWKTPDADPIADPALDAYLHPDDETGEAISHTLLAALKPLGQFHHHLQSLADGPDANPEKTTERQQKRRFTRSVRERIGRYRMEKDVKPHKVRSKIKQTVKEATSAEEMEEEHWWDFDLGECLLELQDDEVTVDGVPSKKLCVFSSLEVTLTDEDLDTDSTDDVCNDNPSAGNNVDRDANDLQVEPYQNRNGEMDSQVLGPTGGEGKE